MQNTRRRMCDHVPKKRHCEHTCCRYSHCVFYSSLGRGELFSQPVTVWCTDNLLATCSTLWHLIVTLFFFGTHFQLVEAWSTLTTFPKVRSPGWFINKKQPLWEKNLKGKLGLPATPDLICWPFMGGFPSWATMESKPPPVSVLIMCTQTEPVSKHADGMQVLHVAMILWEQFMRMWLVGMYKC